MGRGSGKGRGAGGGAGTQNSNATGPDANPTTYNGILAQVQDMARNTQNYTYAQIDQVTGRMALLPVEQQRQIAAIIGRHGPSRSGADARNWINDRTRERLGRIERNQVIRDAYVPPA